MLSVIVAKHGHSLLRTRASRRASAHQHPGRAWLNETGEMARD
jgi:hypothetical protein